LRTKKEMSKAPAHHELIPEIVALRDEIAPGTLLTINGDIENRQQGLDMIAQNPGVNGVMIGRGIFHDPFAFAPTPDPNQSLDGVKSSKLVDLLRHHLDLYDQWRDKTSRPYETLKRFFKI